MPARALGSKDVGALNLPESWVICRAERILMPEHDERTQMTGRQILRQLIYAILLVGVLGAIWEGVEDGLHPQWHDETDQ